ncbi:ABC transporter substrate-binding protein [Siccirubricoccus deserti]|uniref:ABC transporter substrate-binding protein n=1 Tax=Siccirubricoccus deserti TaxID=2013562 RepID=A0A9X0QWZ7_9PROT|nr:ABC transporter substrate-binding protein [Siccirubricoccus deserti]MBC4014798.1 ABC transporter substrate-binding protein [Siccirubricoccus deserti]GGC35110.1 ABC transporter substrate-binding protein [Siccirubricoccus deserti]
MRRPALATASALGLLLAAFASAHAQTANGPAAGATLNIGIGGSVTSLDPHFYNATPNNSLAMHLFDRLVERDERAQPYPGLAESWRVISDTVWEFKLRPGVTWHDGRAFTAEDVAFTIQRAPSVPGSPGGFGGFLRAIQRVEVVDPLTIRIHTPQAHPLLPTELASVAVISRHVGEGASTEDYNSGKAAIGTGPYRFAGYRAGDRTELVRNENYFRGAEPWARVNYRFIGNDAGRTAALLAGDVDVIDQVPPTDMPRLRRDQRITLSEIQGVRLIYVVLDRSRRSGVPFVTDNDGKPLDTNPFDDLRVRRALSMAINRQALADRVMEGTAQPTGQWLPDGTFGYNPEVKPPAFDPDGAKRLLAEAGYPQGFRITFHTPNDRYPNDAKASQALAQMWTRIGIRTEVEAAPWATFSVRSNRQEYGLRLGGWGSTTGEASYALVNILGTYDREKRTGASNNGRYSNPELDALTARAAATIDDPTRAALLREGVRMAMEDVALIPLFQLVNTWALKRGLSYAARMDERTLAMAVRRQ